MTIQIDYDDVVAINTKFTNGGGVVIDEAVVRSAVGRPFHGFGGVEFYPSLIGKPPPCSMPWRRRRGS